MIKPHSACQILWIRLLSATDRSLHLSEKSFTSKFCHIWIGPYQMFTLYTISKYSKKLFVAGHYEEIDFNEKIAQTFKKNGFYSEEKLMNCYWLTFKITSKNLVLDFSSVFTTCRQYRQYLPNLLRYAPVFVRLVLTKIVEFFSRGRIKYEISWFNVKIRKSIKSWHLLWQNIKFLWV